MIKSGNLRAIVASVSRFLTHPFRRFIERNKHTDLRVFFTREDTNKVANVAGLVLTRFDLEEDLLGDLRVVVKEVQTAVNPTIPALFGIAT